MDKLPVLISVPHGGTQVPVELADRVCLSAKDQFEDGDAFTREIYGVENEVQAFVSGTIARAYIDLNRDINDRPPENPDGVVKSKTCFGKPIYHQDKGLNDEMIEFLIQKYHQPYHQSISQKIKSENKLELMLDCHSMETIGPEISYDRGKVRPKFCLGSNKGKSCSPMLVERMAQCLKTEFGLNDEEVRIDVPFSGGHITRSYGNKPIPCIQIEMNRDFYLRPPWFEPETLEVALDRIKYLRINFLKTLTLFFS